MNTITYLTDPELRSLYWPSVITGLALAAMCSALSVVVVLKRLAFVGQGISHAAFGGIGVAAMTAALAGVAMGQSAGVTLAQYGIIFAFCAAAALFVGVVSRRGGVEADTAIGIVLVASMAAGSILVFAARSTIKWESFLFGTILNVGWLDAVVAWIMAAVVTGALVAMRRPLVFWAFDESAAKAWGVRTTWVQVAVMVMLALATVTAMKLAGVVLATALLVLPGAIALRLSRRLWRVLALAVAASMVGVIGGVVVSFEQDWPPGASIVLVLTALFALAAAFERLALRRTTRRVA
jgi:ABC-type Mn2+/Zn2+ transport system permease subunit